MVFFTIPWIFVIALVVIALGIGVSALQFILDHIIIISIILGLPVAWLVWGTWKTRIVRMRKKWSVCYIHFFWFRRMQN